MSTPEAKAHDEPGTMNTRLLVRKAAAEIAGTGEYPTPELVRVKIQADTRGNLNPSNTTVTDELKKWRKDTFWPTFSAFGELPEDSQVPAAVRQIFTEAYRTIVVQLLGKAKSDWNDERDEFKRQLAEADQGMETLRLQIADLDRQMTSLNEQHVNDAAQLIHALDVNATLTQERMQLADELKAALQKQADHERDLNEVRAAERQRADAVAETARSEQNRLHLEIDSSRQAVKRLEATAATSATATAAALDKVSKLERELAAAQTELAVLRESHRREVMQLSDALAKAASAAVPHAEVTRKIGLVPRDRMTRPVRQSLRKSKPAR